MARRTVPWTTASKYGDTICAALLQDQANLSQNRKKFAKMGDGTSKSMTLCIGLFQAQVLSGWIRSGSICTQTTSLRLGSQLFQDGYF